MKKFLFPAVAALLLTVGAAHAAPKNFDGFYAGASVGGSVSRTGIAGVDLYGEGAKIGLLGGYGISFENFYFGAEANGSWANLETKVGGTTLEKDYGYGIGGRLGYVITPTTLGYGIVGWERGRFETTGVHGENWADGLKLGAGVEQVIADNITLRGELSAVNWKKKDLDNVEVREIGAKLGLAYRF